MILFLNDNDSSVSIKPLTKSYQNIQITERAVMFSYETASQSFQTHSIISVLQSFILSQKYWDKSL